MEVCSYEHRFKRERKICVIFLCVSLFVPVFSYLVPIRPLGEGVETWFQRSGSVMVVFALLGEMHAYQMFDVFKPSGFVGSTYEKTKTRYYSQVKYWNYLSIVFVSVGTLIWGYGDLFLKWYK